MDDIDDLERIAREATGDAPGEWFFAYNRIVSSDLSREYDRIERTFPDDIVDDDPRWNELPDPDVAWVEASHGDTASPRGARLARHIATFSPATVLALLAELRAARAVVAAAEAVAAEMEHDVAIVEQYRDARQRGGQHVGTGGQLGALPLSGLAAIRRYARDIRSTIDAHRTRKP